MYFDDLGKEEFGEASGFVGGSYRGLLLCVHFHKMIAIPPSELLGIIITFQLWPVPFTYIFHKRW